MQILSPNHCASVVSFLPALHMPLVSSGCLFETFPNPGQIKSPASSTTFKSPASSTGLRIGVGSESHHLRAFGILHRLALHRLSSLLFHCHRLSPVSSHDAAVTTSTPHHTCSNATLTHVPTVHST